jgi:hypothetical protein
MRCWDVGDEQLAAAGIFPQLGHAHRPPAIAPAVDLVGDGVTGAAPAVPLRIAALDHEVRHHTVPGQAVIQAVLHQFYEVGHVHRRIFREAFDFNHTLAGFQDDYRVGLERPGREIGIRRRGCLFSNFFAQPLQRLTNLLPQLQPARSG